MRILIDIDHPGHVHMFKNFYFEMLNRGHTLFVTVRNHATTRKLLNNYAIPYIIIGEKGSNILSKAIKQFESDRILRKILVENRIEMAIGSSFNIARVSRALNIPSIVMDDDDDTVEPLFVKFAHPYASVLLSPDALIGYRKRPDTIFYAGYHELAYLHPCYFNPDSRILDELSLTSNSRYFVLRFNAFRAYHDIGQRGLNLKQKLQLIDTLKVHGRVFITTEGEIEPELEKYRLKVSPEKIHHLLYYATMFIGDSQTMTSEAAILGTPAFKCNSFAHRLAVPNELEYRYGLCFAFQPYEFDKMLKHIELWLAQPDLKYQWQKKRQNLLKDKINVTKFWIWLIENYPHSIHIMSKNSKYQLRFK